MTNKIYKLFQSIDYGLLVAIIIPIIGILPTFGEGLANGADAPFHAHRIYALSELIQSGNLYPRWVSYFHMGYGYPIFNFYPPFATHIGAWLHLIGFDVITAYNLTNALVWCISSIGMYLLARTFLPIRIALLACVIWVYAPSRFFEFWWQGSLAQIVATSFIPFVFYGIIRTTKSPTLKNSLWIAIPFAIIILSHVPTTYLTALFVAPLCFVLPLLYRSLRAILKRWILIGTGLVISAGLSAIFLMPVFAELQYIEIAGDLPDTVEFLRQNFGTLSEIFSFPAIIDGTDATLIMPRALGLIGGILSISGLFALVVRRKFGIALLLIVGLGFAVFLTIEPSLDVWLSIPSFRNLRFPERILRMGAIFTALLGASSLLFIPKRWHTVGFIAISALVIFQTLPMMHPRDDDRIWDNVTAVDEIMMEFDEHNWGTTAYDEYEPIWGEITPLDMPPYLERYVDTPFQIRLLEADIVRESDTISHTQIDNNQIHIVAEQESVMRFRQFYFPGWEVTIDGIPVSIEPDERFGLIEAILPAGDYLVQLDYVGTPIQHIASVISIITAISCMIIIWRGKSITEYALYPAEGALSPQFVTLFWSATILFAVINTAVLQDNLFRIHSPIDNPHYMQTPVNLTFDNNITLLGYTLDSETISPENPLGIRFYWRIEDETEKDYRPIIQLVNLTVSESWAVSQPLDFEGGKISQLSPNQFISDRHKLELFDDVQPYIGQISVQLLQSKNEGIVTTLADNTDRIILPDIIRVNTPSQPYQGDSANITVGDLLTIDCIGLESNEEAFKIELQWEVNQPSPIEYKMFIHGLNDEGEIIEQADRLPFDSQYPSSYWLSSQHLVDTIQLTFDPSISNIALGFYNPADATRLPVMIGDTRSDYIKIPIKDTSCAT